MEHCMAVWTDRGQIFDRIDFSRGDCLVERVEMVDVGEAISNRSVEQFKIEFTNRTRQAVGCDTGCASFGIAFGSFCASSRPTPFLQILAGLIQSGHDLKA